MRQGYTELASDFLDTCFSTSDPRKTGKVQYEFAYSNLGEVFIKILDKEFLFPLPYAELFVKDLKRIIAHGIIDNSVTFEFMKKLIDAFEIQIRNLKSAH